MNVNNNNSAANYPAKTEIKTRDSKAASLQLKSASTVALAERTKNIFYRVRSYVENRVQKEPGFHRTRKFSIDQDIFKKIKSYADAKFNNLDKIVESPSKPEIAAKPTKNPQVLIWSKDGLQRIEIEASEAARVPPGTADKLSEWLDHNAPKLAKKTSRVPYSKEQIAPALEAFEKECGCSWQQMKHKWGNQRAFMQIINDVRAQQIDEISTKLRADAELSGLQIFDFGSDKLTSDRDLSLSIAGNRETEVLAVKKYNLLFEATGWKATAAHVFDNNAYTQFYIENLHKVDHQQEQQALHHIMSYVMFVRNAGKESWENLKNEILANADAVNISTLKKQFVRVESLVNHLEQEHNREMFNVMAKKGADSEIPAELAHQTQTAKGLERANPQMLVKVDNALHDKYKENISNAIAWRTQLNQHIDSMSKNNADPLEAFTQATKLVGNFLTHRKDELQAEYEFMQTEAAHVGASDPKKGIALRERSKLIKNELNSIPTQIANLQKGLPAKDTIEKWGACKAKISAANRELQKKDNLHLHSQLKQQIQDTEKEMENCNLGDIGKLEKLLEMSDKMQLSIEANQMKAQCFAQEAHVTAGAFGFVVQDIQGGRTAPRTLGAYMQATNELMGFYHAHQSHAHTPHGKMIEVSKYVGPRLIECYTRMQGQAAANGVSFPTFEKSENIQHFFNELLAMRGGSIHPDTLKMGLEQVEDDQIKKCNSQLLQCKSQGEALAVLQQNGAADKIGLIDKYFTVAKEGGVPESQQKTLVSEIAQRHQLPVIAAGRRKGEVDTEAIDKIMNSMHAQTAAWMASLPSKQVLTLSQQH